MFGDIGTSPLYALQTVFTADNHAVQTTSADVYGVVSLVFWTITIEVSIKYVTFVMRADNGGEGGIMALTALLQGAKFKTARAKFVLITLGILGASLFYGDGVITPAISVLSAVEGLKVATRRASATSSSRSRSRCSSRCSRSSASGPGWSGGSSAPSW